jgi:hypothetical protein
MIAITEVFGQSVQNKFVEIKITFHDAKETKFLITQVDYGFENGAR